MKNIRISLKFVHGGPADKQVSIGSGNDLTSNRRQAIIWTNADSVHRRIYAALGGDELILEISIPSCPGHWL